MVSDETTTRGRARISSNLQELGGRLTAHDLEATTAAILKGQPESSDLEDSLRASLERTRSGETAGERKRALRKIMRAARKSAGTFDGSDTASNLWASLQRELAALRTEESSRLHSQSNLDRSAKSSGGTTRAGGQGTSLIAFEALPGELDLSHFLAEVQAKVWLPVISAAGGTPLSELPIGFTSEGEPQRVDVSADLIIVPALAIDEAGARLGQGGGWYDRALETVKRKSPSAPVFAAIPSYAFLAAGTIPTEPHDMRIDGVITERGWVLL
ncbi:MAG: 5-formyltetrahydrofolate cyclo-ligase [Actinomycetaceae bacterium]|nr:5-formyltetrahydrofolate cyclo-ligase [Actinomycetaceae bacterium]